MKAKATTGRTMRVVGRKLLVSVTDGGVTDRYWVWAAVRSDGTVVRWWHESDASRRYNVRVVGNKRKRASDCTCDHTKNRGADAPKCRHRAGTEVLISKGELEVKR